MEWNSKIYVYSLTTMTMTIWPSQNFLNTLFIHLEVLSLSLSFSFSLSLSLSFSFSVSLINILISITPGQTVNWAIDKSMRLSLSTGTEKDDNTFCLFLQFRYLREEECSPLYTCSKGGRKDKAIYLSSISLWKSVWSVLLILVCRTTLW